MIGIYPKLSKEYVLSKVTQEQIFEKYLLIKIPNSSQDRIKSPLRPDKNPTCTFYYSGNKLKMKDWAGFFHGDCFDAVAAILNVNANSKDGFVKILDDICRNFSIHKYAEGEYTYTVINAKNYHLYQKDEAADIQIAVRKWNKYDGEYWSQFKVITLKDLREFIVYPVDVAWINGKQIYKYYFKDPCYFYYIDKDLEGKNRGQLYFPNRPKGQKFRNNTTQLFGKNHLTCAEILFLTKSNKDILTLRGLIRRAELPIEVCALAAESLTLSKEDYSELWTKYDLIISLFDFDFAGRNAAWRHQKLYNISPLFFTDGTRGSKMDYKAKDASEFVARNDLDNSLKLINNTYEYIRRKFL